MFAAEPLIIERIKSVLPATVAVQSANQTTSPTPRMTSVIVVPAGGDVAEMKNQGRHVAITEQWVIVLMLGMSADVQGQRQNAGELLETMLTALIGYQPLPNIPLILTDIGQPDYSTKGVVAYSLTFTTKHVLIATGA